MKKYLKHKKNYKITTKNTNHLYLCYTNLLLNVSVLYFLFNRQKNTPLIEYIFAGSLIITIIFSQIFWINPIKQSRIHNNYN